MTTQYRDIAWLAGLVFIKRDFIKEAEEKGLDAFFERCPYGDLTEEQREAFTAAFENHRLREIVSLWWQTYDEERKAGHLPESGTPWEA